MATKELLEKSSERKFNYQKQLEKVLKKIQSNPKEDGSKPTLCLHACCGPCSSYVLEYLAEYFDITVLFYNPNVYPAEEYYRRLNELKNLYTRFPPVLENKVKLVEMPYDPQDYYKAINVQNEPYIADEPEKGERCRRCYELRLKCTYNYANSKGFDYFCTTLSISSFKDAEKINTEGLKLSGGFLWRGRRPPESHEPGPKWLPSDFKKAGGFNRSLELTEKYGLYRQEYCGCVYSANSVAQKEENSK